MSTEDTTAQLREQIAAVFDGFDTYGAVCGSYDEVTDKILPIVLAQVEAAKATARRDALLEAADDAEKVRYPLDGGSVAEWLRARASAQGAAAEVASVVRPPCTCEYVEQADGCPTPCPKNKPYRSLAQGVDPGYGARSVSAVNARKGTPGSTSHGADRTASASSTGSDPAEVGQGAQSSGHEFEGDPGMGLDFPCVHPAEPWRYCGMTRSHPIHKRGPGQPGEQDTAEEGR